MSEREARQAAEKSARDWEARSTQVVAQAQAVQRQANLTVALVEKGLTGGKARAAVRLLDGIEYDANELPTNLDARIEAASAAYDTDLFAATATPTPTNGHPNVHPGARTTPGPDEEAQLAAYMAANFPQLTPPPSRSTA